MNTSTKVIIGIFLLAVLALVLVGNAKASEVSDYKYLVSHQDTLRNYTALNDMAYHYGGMTKLDARMAAFDNVSVLVVNSYAAYNPMTGNLDWTGYWGTN